MPKNVQAVLATQHLLCHLATLFQHETNINPVIAGSLLGNVASFGQRFIFINLHVGDSDVDLD